MQIALCDDEERQIDALEGFLRAYEAEHGLNLKLTRFSSGEALLAAPVEFSIVFMDIYLDGLLGTETIRRLGREAQVVFITTSREHAIEAFSLGAVHYLMKPVEQAAVWEAMDRCLARLGTNAGPVLHIQTSHGSVPISAAQITYIEVFDKLCVVHMVKQQFQTYTALNTLFEQLDGNRFLRPQRSFVVNMEFIGSFLSSKLILKDGTEISLSRNNRAEPEGSVPAVSIRPDKEGEH